MKLIDRDLYLPRTRNPQYDIEGIQVIDIAEDLEFEEWYFGHWHMDESVENFRGLYQDIVELN